MIALGPPSPVGPSKAAGYDSSTTCPSDSRRRAVSSTAAALAGSASRTPGRISRHPRRSGSCLTNPTRKHPVSAPTSSLKGRRGGGAANRSPGAGPETASRTAAASRTDRVSTCSTMLPSNPASPTGVRPRDGLRPTSPQDAAGMRIEPVPSFACATGTMPDATAAADPPLDPPAERVGFQGFRVGPKAAGSVVAEAANSGRLVLPRIMNPACRKRLARFESAGERQRRSRRNREPS